MSSITQAARAVVRYDVPTATAPGHRIGAQIIDRRWCGRRRSGEVGATRMPVPTLQDGSNRECDEGSEPEFGAFVNELLSHEFLEWR